VIAAYIATSTEGLCNATEESDVGREENARLKAQIQQYQSTTTKLKSRIEGLVAENSQLHESVEVSEFSSNSSREANREQDD
jgi:uncharacterized protein YlxW (UPF0749 family)